MYTRWHAHRENAQRVSKARLDHLLKTGRPHRQKTIWDTKETGLSGLISRGPKHKRQGTVTLRVVYYLKDKPGVVRDAAGQVPRQWDHR
jgi:hypothetical protein